MIHLWQKTRATKAEKARHLNAARGLLQSQGARADAVRQRPASSISPSVKPIVTSKKHLSSIDPSKFPRP